MKKYNAVEIELIIFQAQDVITSSLGFDGVLDEDGFGNPNGTDNANFSEN
jgi:hypothetical protein